MVFNVEKKRNHQSHPARLAGFPNSRDCNGIIRSRITFSALFFSIGLVLLEISSLSSRARLKLEVERKMLCFGGENAELERFFSRYVRKVLNRFIFL
jgi:hypothetical protein